MYMLNPVSTPWNLNLRLWNRTLLGRSAPNSLSLFFNIFLGDPNGTIRVQDAFAVFFEKIADPETNGTAKRWGFRLENPQNRPTN